jgi:hypothetical protein
VGNEVVFYAFLETGNKATNIVGLREVRVFYLHQGHKLLKSLYVV